MQKYWEKSGFLLFFLLLYDFLSLKTDVNLPSKIKKHQNSFFVDILKATDEKKEDPDLTS